MNVKPAHDTALPERQRPWNNSKTIRVRIITAHEDPGSDMLKKVVTVDGREYIKRSDGVLVRVHPKKKTKRNLKAKK